MNLEMLGQIAGVASVIGTLFHFAVLRPLNESIIRLDCTLKRMEEQLEKMSEAHHVLDRKVAEVDQRAKSAHARLDELMKMIRFERA